MELNQPQPPVFNPQQPMQQYQPRVTASPMMDPVTAVITCFKKFFDFKGRARRSEFWWFVLFVLIVSSALTFFSGLVPAISYLSMAFTLAMAIPQFSALTRRLHDTGRSGWWASILAALVLLYYVSLAKLLGSDIGALADSTDVMGMAETMANAVQSSPMVATTMICSLLGAFFFLILNVIFAAMDSKWGENKYGPSPKYQ